MTPISLRGKTNFFEKHVSEYAKAVLTSKLTNTTNSATGLISNPGGPPAPKKQDSQTYLC
jgi:hypothetical protein